jgi:hypothetical protein
LNNFSLLKGYIFNIFSAYTPQQNGVVERKNRSLKEMVGCMIHTCSLAPEYWVEDINCDAHIQNRVLHKALKGITPFEAWCGRKPVVWTL